MSNSYVFVWAALAVLTVILAIKHEKIFFVFTGFFVFMTLWQSLKAFWKLPVTDGALGWVFRGVMIAYLVVAMIIWIRAIRTKKRGNRNDGDEGE